MSVQVYRYEVDGEEFWAAWTTVSEEWMVYGLDEEEFREWYVGYFKSKAGMKAARRVDDRIETLRDGSLPVTTYHSGIRKDDEERLRSLHDEYKP